MLLTTRVNKAVVASQFEEYYCFCKDFRISIYQKHGSVKKVLLVNVYGQAGINKVMKISNKFTSALMTNHIIQSAESPTDSNEFSFSKNRSGEIPH